MEIFKTVKEHLVAIGFTKPDVEFHTEQVFGYRFAMSLPAF